MSTSTLHDASAAPCGNGTAKAHQGGPVMESTEIPAHEFAQMFPLRPGKPLDDLAASIREHGLKEEIVVYQGKVLDGRRRQTACRKAGVKPLYREFGSRATDGISPLEFSFAVNYHRRDDLTVAEKAIAAAKYSNAKKGYNQHTASADGRPMASQAQAAEKFGTTTKQIQRAKKVLSKGTPELQAAMQAEEVSISDAAAIAGEKPATQKKAIKAVKNGKASTLREAVEKEHGPLPEDPVKFAAELDALIARVPKLPVGNGNGKARVESEMTRGLLEEALNTARVFVGRLICAAENERLRKGESS
jgi:ParB-like chromosome segregation protein Spo0J